MISYNKGFTLLELMVVVAIIGIITMFAYPSYQNSQRKARISEGVAGLMAAQSQIETYRLNNRALYKDITLAKANIPNKIQYSGKDIYTLTYAADTTTPSNKYRLTATATGTWLPSTDECATLSIVGSNNVRPTNCQK